MNRITDRSVLLALAGATLSAALAHPACAQCTLEFAWPVSYAAPAMNDGKMAFADFNDDGRTDVAYPTAGGVAVLLSDGAGGFLPATVYPTPSQTTSIAVADMNGDGRPDLLAPQISSVGIMLFLNSAETPGVFLTPNSIGGGALNQGIAVSDINGDGFADVAMGVNQGALRIMYGSGVAGQFPVSSYTNSGPFTQSDCRGIVIGDFNGDGRQDVVVLLATEMRYSPGRPDGELGVGSGNLPIVIPTGPDSRAIAKGDFNGDGRDDVAVACFGLTGPLVFMGMANNTFAPPVQYGLAAHPSSIVVADVNADGKLDLVTSCPEVNIVAIHAGQTGGTFAPFVAYAGGSAPYAAGVGQADGDGELDLITLSQEGLTVLKSSNSEPIMVVQPESQTKNAGMFTTFTASARAGLNAVSYQWFRNGAPIPEGLGATGVNQPTLSVGPLSLADTGSTFQCAISNACGSVNSIPVSLIVEPACISDYNRDGYRNPDDLADFITIFFISGSFSGCGS